jgi:hypothetical protein
MPCVNTFIMRIMRKCIHSRINSHNLRKDCLRCSDCYAHFSQDRNNTSPFPSSATISAQHPKSRLVNRPSRDPPSRDDGWLCSLTSAPTTDPCRLRQGTWSPCPCSQGAALNQTSTGNPAPWRADASCRQDDRHPRQPGPGTLGSPDPLSTQGCLAQAQAQQQHHLRLQAKRRGQHTRTALSQVADALLLANLPGACPPCFSCAEPILIGLTLLTKTKDTGYIMQ